MFRTEILFSCVTAEFSFGRTRRIAFAEANVADIVNVPFAVCCCSNAGAQMVNNVSLCPSDLLSSGIAA